MVGVPVARHPPGRGVGLPSGLVLVRGLGLEEVGTVPVTSPTTRPRHAVTRPRRGLAGQDVDPVGPVRRRPRRQVVEDAGRVGPVVRPTKRPSAVAETKVAPTDDAALVRAARPFARGPGRPPAKDAPVLDHRLVRGVARRRPGRVAAREGQVEGVVVLVPVERPEVVVPPSQQVPSGRTPSGVDVKGRVDDAPPTPDGRQDVVVVVRRP